MATLNLGAIRYNWKGAYSGSTAYVVNDVVSANGNSYICIQAGTGQAVGNATAYWNIMSSAGTNGTDGTDLTSTLTTRGDILYKGASALTRLPKGTAGYVLKQGANDPEWGEASGGALVKLISTKVAGSNVSNITINSTILSSTYTKFKFYFQLYGVNADPQNLFAFPSIDNGSNYNRVAFSAATSAYVKFDGSNDGDYRTSMAYANNNSWKIGGAIEGANAGADAGAFQGEATLFNTESSSYSNSAHFLWQGGRYYNAGSGNEHVMVYNGHAMACRLGTGGKVNNIKFQWGQGNIQVDSRITVYGIKED